MGFLGATNSVVETPAAQVTVLKPVSATVGTVMVAAVASPAPVSAAPAGWTHLTTQEVTKQVGATARTKLWLGTWVRVTGASEPASYMWELTQSLSGTLANIVVYNGVELVDPVRAVKGSTAAPGSSKTIAGGNSFPPPNPAEFGPVQDVAFYVGGAFWDSGDTTVPVTRSGRQVAFSAPTGQVERTDFDARFSSNGQFAYAGLTMSDKTNQFGPNQVGTTVADNTINVGAVVYVSLVRAFPPDAPTLLAPDNSSTVDLAGGRTFSWTFNDRSPADKQSQFAFKRVEGGTTRYWRAFTSTWETSETWNTDVRSKVLFPAGAWANGPEYTWAVATRDLAGNTGPYSAPWTVTGADTIPTVTVTEPSATVETTARPAVQWVFSDTGASTQAYYRVRIFPIAKVSAAGFSPDQPGATWETGWRRSTNLNTQIGVPLNDGYWVAFVRARNSAGVSSEWAQQAFQVAVTAPGVPLVTAVGDNTLARVQVDVVGSGAGWWDAIEDFIVEVSDDGVSWSQLGDVRTASVVRTATAFDYTARSGVPRLYRARTVADADGRQVESATTAAVEAEVVLVEWWLTDLADPSGHVGLFVEDAPARFTRTAEEGQFVALGRKHTIVVSGARHGEQISFTALFFEDAPYFAYDALLDRQVPLMLRDDVGGAFTVQILSPRDTELLPTRPMRRVEITAVEVA